MAYFRRILSRAWQMTRSDLRLTNWRQVLARALLAAVALALILGFLGWDVVGDRAGVAAFTALAFVIVFVADFLMNLLLAPAVLQREAEETIARLGRELDDKQARESALKSLWGLRKDGVELRNERITSRAYIPIWLERVQSWRKSVLAESEKVNVNLRYYLEILNEMGDPPADLSLWGGEHENWVTIVSEILRRLEGFLYKTL